MLIMKLDGKEYTYRLGEKLAFSYTGWLALFKIPLWGKAAYFWDFSL